MTAVGLAGSWKLLSAQVEMADTGQRIDLYGPKPIGRAILTDSGYVTFILTAGDRPVPTTELDGAGLFKSMMAYTGDLSARGRRQDHHHSRCVLASWMEWERAGPLLQARRPWERIRTSRV